MIRSPAPTGSVVERWRSAMRLVLVLASLHPARSSACTRSIAIASAAPTPGRLQPGRPTQTATDNRGTDPRDGDDPQDHRPGRPPAAPGLLRRQRSERRSGRNAERAAREAPCCRSTASRSAATSTSGPSTIDDWARCGSPPRPRRSTRTWAHLVARRAGRVVPDDHAQPAARTVAAPSRAAQVSDRGDGRACSTTARCLASPRHPAASRQDAADSSLCAMSTSPTAGTSRTSPSTSWFAGTAATSSCRTAAPTRRRVRRSRQRAAADSRGLRRRHRARRLAAAAGRETASRGSMSPSARSLLGHRPRHPALRQAVDHRRRADRRAAVPGRATPRSRTRATGDQFYDEAQWESYRRLGLHAAECIFDFVARRRPRRHRSPTPTGCSPKLHPGDRRPKGSRTAWSR